jgi:hypothetical protein
MFRKPVEHHAFLSGLSSVAATTEDGQEQCQQRTITADVRIRTGTGRVTLRMLGSRAKHGQCLQKGLSKGSTLGTWFHHNEQPGIGASAIETKSSPDCRSWPRIISEEQIRTTMRHESLIERAIRVILEVEGLSVKRRGVQRLSGGGLML